jgi:hypothetical protein
LRRILEERKYSGKRVYGWVYHDPNGTAPISNVLEPIYDMDIYKTLDIVFNLSASNIKRCKGRYPEKPSLPEHLEKLNKIVWHISRPFGRHQFSFVIGGNDWKTRMDWLKSRFYDVETNEGRQIYEKICKTAGELELCKS